MVCSTAMGGSTAMVGLIDMVGLITFSVPFLAKTRCVSFQNHQNCSNLHQLWFKLYIIKNFKFEILKTKKLY